MFQILFYPKIVCAVLPIDKCYDCMSRSLMFTAISLKILRTLSSSSWSLMDKGTPIISIVSRREFCTFSLHCRSVYTTLSIGFEFTFFLTIKSASSFVKYPSRSFTSDVRFVICEAKLCSICSTSFTSSDLLSFFRTSSVWVVDITIEQLQYLQN